MPPIAVCLAGDTFVFPGGTDMVLMDQMSQTPKQECPYVGLAREYNAFCDKLNAATIRIAELEAKLGACARAGCPAAKASLVGD